MRKPDFCICKKTLRSEVRLCFHYIDSTIPLLAKSESSNLKPFSVIVQPGLCRTCSETPKDRFSCDEAQLSYPRPIRQQRSTEIKKE